MNGKELEPLEFAVLCSSNGTTFGAVLDDIKNGTVNAVCKGLITDKTSRKCIEKANEYDIPVAVLPKTNGNKLLNDDLLCLALEQILGDSPPDRRLVAALGWKKLLSQAVLEKWPNILNVHPSLLPKYPGLHAHRKVLEAEEEISGMTIHWVDKNVDTGPRVLQKRCSLLPDDTEDSLKERVQTLEKKWYPFVLQEISRGKIKLLMEPDEINSAQF